MVASYVIVRYVIVKPVKHLRDVSDAIAAGKLTIRSQIQTGDEFEELSHAFNRMLHNLVAMQQELRAVNHDLDKKVDELAQALQSLELAKSKVWTSQAETIFRLARMVEFRDEETGQHVHRMSGYCEILARQIGYSAEDTERLRLASQLHDVGKVAIPDGVLLKPGKLTLKEFEVIKGHTDAGYKMLVGSGSEVVQLGALIAYTHHEHWDGTGYPLGLAGEAIPLVGRIVAVADVFDALTNDRPYKSAWSPEDSVAEIKHGAGKKFDPRVVAAFLATHQ